MLRVCLLSTARRRRSAFWQPCASRPRYLPEMSSRCPILESSRRLSSGLILGKLRGPSVAAWRAPQQALARPDQQVLDKQQQRLTTGQRHSRLRYGLSPQQQVPTTQPDQLQSSDPLHEVHCAVEDTVDDDRRASHGQAGPRHAAMPSFNQVQHDQQHSSLSPFPPAADVSAKASPAEANDLSLNGHANANSGGHAEASSSHATVLQPGICILDGAVQKVIFRSHNGYCILKVRATKVRIGITINLPTRSSTCLLEAGALKAHNIQPCLGAFMTRSKTHLKSMHHVKALT